MDDKTIIDITNLDAENVAKRVASYSEKLLNVRRTSTVALEPFSPPNP